MQWIADRFFTQGDVWLDASSGRAVRLRLSQGGADDDLAWNEGCARLSNLRHPLLNPLLDYGTGPDGSRFEAYACEGAVAAPASSALGECALRHLTRFLHANGVVIDADLARYLPRPVIAGRGDLQRPLGFTVQGRRALEALEETLDETWPVGPTVVNLIGACQGGLRTLRTLAARAARIRGFVPLDIGLAATRPQLMESLLQRHVCLLDDADDTRRPAAATARVLSMLAAGSTRRHLLIRFRRRETAREKAIALDPLGVRSLVGMVFVGGEGDPGEEELFTAARASEGLPGVFLARLYGAFPPPARPMVVHERAPDFLIESSPLPPVPAPAEGRMVNSALGARTRAAGLARAGRHAVAMRVLLRGMRVLEGRNRHLEAAACAMQLGWLCLDRGATGAASAHFERARGLATGAPLSVMATIGQGVALTDERRLIEAEAVLRGAAAAAETIHDATKSTAAAAALARCLLWQHRWEEAVAVASTQREVAGEAQERVRLLAVLARGQARLGRTALAVSTARAAQREAAGTDLRTQASAESSLAEALEAAGDAEGARAAVSRLARLARGGHLPLFRIRGLLLAARLSESSQIARALARLRRLKAPVLLAHRLELITREPPPQRLEPVAELERLLDGSQRAADDGAAALHVCTVVSERLGASTVAIFGSDDRALAVVGRGWPSMPASAREAIAQGIALRPDGRREPQESAEPIRYGGELIAALACRWVAGTTIDVAGAAVLLRAAALSTAPHVRAILDRVVPIPAPACGDLIGESPPAVALREAMARAARAPFSVLVEGESGCGKELVARAIHRLSLRRDRRFCALNCAALTDDLVEAELFGHARGAFTGAATERAGLFEEADGGTLFLDEVGELSARAQAKLLRVLQEGEVRRVGENFSRRVDVRVVAATNRRLEEEATAGRFRVDLRFRLDVVRITVPPLRDRTSDIPLLAAHFWQDASARVGSRATLSREALAALARYDWPGNVRELQNVIAWVAVHSPRRGRIGASTLPRHVAQSTVTSPCTFEAAREEFERRFIRAALAGANGQRTRAADALGVTRQGLSKMMRRLRIDGV
jgi:transcriptional regulator with AAA-type ATPase domain